MGNDQIIDKLIADGKLDEAIEMLTQLINQAKKENKQESLGELYFRRGKLYWRTGNRPAATTDYAHAAHINPDGPAATALQQAREIADFYNHDLYNP